MNNQLWSEFYRPPTIDDCVLPSNIASTFKQIIASGQVMNMLLVGPRGRGKTTAARALCNELELDHLVINGSEDSGIEVLRGRIRQFASSCSLQGQGKVKVVIIDEADYLNPQSTQPALRGFIEEFAGACRFIFTCNYPNKIIPEIRESRLATVDFKIQKKDMPKLAERFFRRMSNILTENQIKFDPKLLVKVVMAYAPDWRRVISECQMHSLSGELTPDALLSLSDESFDTLITHLKGKNFREMRKWVGVNSDLDASVIFRRVYDILSVRAKPETVPHAILIIAEYQYKACMVVDQEINIVACMTELMRDVEWVK